MAQSTFERFRAWAAAAYPEDFAQDAVVAPTAAFEDVDAASLPDDTKLSCGRRPPPEYSGWRRGTHAAENAEPRRMRAPHAARRYWGTEDWGTPRDAPYVVGDRRYGKKARPDHRT